MQTRILYKKDIYNGNLILVNQEYPLHDEYQLDLEYHDLSFQHQLDKKVNQLLNQCMNQLHNQDEIIMTSGYRSLQEQTSLYEQSLEEYGKEYTEMFVAMPHCSEHETGLAFDLALNQEHIDKICPSFPRTGICERFCELCYDYGFVERYGKNKQNITHIAHEPWHFRYVGFPHSLITKEKDLCLEEYHEFLKDYSIYRPYTYVVNHRVFDIFYVPINQEEIIALRSDAIYQVSGNNQDGVIVTVWRRDL